MYFDVFQKLKAELWAVIKIYIVVIMVLKNIYRTHIHLTCYSPYILLDSERY